MVAGNNNAYSYVLLKYGDNATDTVTGVVIYPDDFSFADAGVDALTFGVALPTQIDIDSWRALETAGCVFLSNSLYREYKSDRTITIREELLGRYGTYWSASTQNPNKASRVDFNMYTPSINTNNYNGVSERSLGISVRLVQDL